MEKQYEIINGFHIDYSWSLEEYRRSYGEMYDKGELWDFSLQDIQDGSVEPNVDMVYWGIVVDGEMRIFETYQFEDFEN